LFNPNITKNLNFNKKTASCGFGWVAYYW